MYALRASARLIRSNPRHLPCKSTLPRYMSIAPSPWFIDADQDQAISTPTPTFTARSIPPHIPEEPYKLSDNIPDTVRALYNELSSSPFLDLSTLVAREPLQIPHGPRVAEKQPKGRRRIRGKTYGGESTLDLGSGGVWNWVVMAQVCGLPLTCIIAHAYLTGEGRDGEPGIDRVCCSCCTQDGKSICCYCEFTPTYSWCGSY